MDKIKPNRQQIFEAALDGNIKLLKEYADQGADFNQYEHGEPLLNDILCELDYNNCPYKYKVVKAILSLGVVNLNLLDEDEGNCLIGPMLSMDTQMIKILLEAGANPNLGIGFGPGESFYDYAEFDYRYNVYDFNIPEQPTDDDQKDEDSWLQYLDRMAVKYVRRRPDHLLLLRSFGAKTYKELHDE